MENLTSINSRKMNGDFPSMSQFRFYGTKEPSLPLLKSFNLPQSVASIISKTDNRHKMESLSGLAMNGLNKQFDLPRRSFSEPIDRAPKQIDIMKKISVQSHYSPPRSATSYNPNYSDFKTNIPNQNFFPNFINLPLMETFKLSDIPNLNGISDNIFEKRTRLSKQSMSMDAGIDCEKTINNKLNEDCVILARRAIEMLGQVDEKNTCVYVFYMTDEIFFLEQSQSNVCSCEIDGKDVKIGGSEETAARPNTKVNAAPIDNTDAGSFKCVSQKTWSEIISQLPQAQLVFQRNVRDISTQEACRCTSLLLLIINCCNIKDLGEQINSKMNPSSESAPAESGKAKKTSKFLRLVQERKAREEALARQEKEKCEVQAAADRVRICEEKARSVKMILLSSKNKEVREVEVHKSNIETLNPKTEIVNNLPKLENPPKTENPPIVASMEELARVFQSNCKINDEKNATNSNAVKLAESLIVESFRLSPDFDSGIASSSETMEELNNVESQDCVDGMLSPTKLPTLVKELSPTNVQKHVENCKNVNGLSQNEVILKDGKEEKVEVIEVVKEAASSCEDKLAKIRDMFSKKRSTKLRNESKAVDEEIPAMKENDQAIDSNLVKDNDNQKKDGDMILQEENEQKEMKDSNENAARNERASIASDKFIISFKDRKRRKKKHRSDKSHRHSPQKSVEGDLTANDAQTNEDREKVSPSKSESSHSRVCNKRHKNEHCLKKYKHKERQNFKQIAKNDFMLDSDCDTSGPLYFSPDTLEIHKPSTSSDSSNKKGHIAKIGQFLNKVVCKGRQLKSDDTKSCSFSSDDFKRCSISSVDSTDFDEIKGKFKNGKSPYGSDDSFVIVFSDTAKQLNQNEDTDDNTVKEVFSKKLNQIYNGDSDDSFIVFHDPDDPVGSEINGCYGNDDLFSETESDSEYESTSSEEHVCLCKCCEHSVDGGQVECVCGGSEEEEEEGLKSCLKRRGKKDDRSSAKSDETIIEKKVHFGAEPVIYTPEEWAEEYREARIGKWEQYSRDAERFKMRIQNTSLALDWVLARKHRSVIFFQRFLPLLKRYEAEERARLRAERAAKKIQDEIEAKERAEREAAQKIQDEIEAKERAEREAVLERESAERQALLEKENAEKEKKHQEILIKQAEFAKKLAEYTLAKLEKEKAELDEKLAKLEKNIKTKDGDKSKSKSKVKT